jgi:histidyl-tRNA synthetase
MAVNLKPLTIGTIITLVERQSVDAYLILADPEKQSEALGVAQMLRDAGVRVLSSLSNPKVAKQFQAAEQSGARFGIVIGAEFPDLTIRNLRDRSDRASHVDRILDDIGDGDRA